MNEPKEEPKEITELIRQIRQEDEVLEDMDRCACYNTAKRLKEHYKESKKIDEFISIPAHIAECCDCNGYWNECPYYVVGD